METVIAVSLGGHLGEYLYWWDDDNCGLDGQLVVDIRTVVGR
jgi:hypothetical protein